MKWTRENSFWDKCIALMKIMRNRFYRGFRSMAAILFFSTSSSSSWHWQSVMSNDMVAGSSDDGFHFFFHSWQYYLAARVAKILNTECNFNRLLLNRIFNKSFKSSNWLKHQLSQASLHHKWMAQLSGSRAQLLQIKMTSELKSAILGCQIRTECAHDGSKNRKQMQVEKRRSYCSFVKCRNILSKRN